MRLLPFALLLTLAAAPAGRFESFRVRTAAAPQADIDAWFLPAARPKGTLFVLHGFNNSKDWSLNLQWVRDREGFNLVMPDFRNHGASSRMAGPSTLGYYEVDDVRAVVDWAESRGLARPFLIYGRSMGGATGLRFAAGDKRIEGVFAVSPFKNAELATRQMAEYAVRLIAADKPGQSRVTAGMKSLVSRMAGSGGLETYLDGHNPLPSEARDRLRQVDVPAAVAARDDLRIWIMSGELDAFPPDDQRAILDASRSPPALKRLVVAPGSNHHNTWAFPGDDARQVPGHERLVHDFLRAALTDPPGRPAYPAASRLEFSPVWATIAIGATVLMAVVAVLLYLRLSRRIAAGRAVADGSTTGSLP